jgi:hypothetical protein
MIEIHGDGGKGGNWTQGCVALKNSDIDILFKYVSKGNTVTIIGSTLTLEEFFLQRKVIMEENTKNEAENSSGRQSEGQPEANNGKEAENRPGKQSEGQQNSNLGSHAENQPGKQSENQPEANHGNEAENLPENTPETPLRAIVRFSNKYVKIARSYIETHSWPGKPLHHWPYSCWYYSFFRFRFTWPPVCKFLGKKWAECRPDSALLENVSSGGRS